MLKHWREDDKFKKLSQQNKKNRLSNAEGFGLSLYTCGSILISKRKRRLISNELINKCIFDIQCMIRNVVLVLCYI